MIKSGQIPIVKLGNRALVAANWVEETFFKPSKADKVTDLTQRLSDLNLATRRRIKRKQALYASLKVDRRLYSMVPIRACQYGLNKNDLRVLHALGACASPRGICYASQKHLGEFAGGMDQADVFRAVKRIHQFGLIRLLLPKGKPFKGRYQRGNRYQILYEENAPLPSKYEIELEFGARTRRWS